MQPQGTHVICECCESRVKFARKKCPYCGYTTWPSTVKQAIEDESCDIRSWLEDAVGDMAGHDIPTLKMNLGCGRSEVRAKVEQAIKDGVVDVPGWLADYFFNDIDTLHDLTGDRIHDGATMIMARMDASKEVERRSPPETTRLQIMISIAKDMTQGAHTALRIALDDHIGDWINRIKTNERKQREAEAAAYGDSQIPPGTKELKSTYQCDCGGKPYKSHHGYWICPNCKAKKES